LVATFIKQAGSLLYICTVNARESSNSNIQLKDQFKQEIFSNIQKTIQPQKTVTSIFEKPREGFFLLQQVSIDIKFPCMAAKY
jgi:hypothetical protein